MLTPKEKKVLSSLIIACIIMVLVTTYVAINNPYKSTNVVNNNIYIIHTGGDIEPDFSEIYDDNKDLLATIFINSYQPLLQSANIVANDWNRIAQDIGDVYNKYDAFVVIHGKETLQYTASALSFILENLDKPVVITDKNVASALLLASNTSIPEVMVASKGKLLRACRTINGKDGFYSPNYPPLTKDNCLSLPNKQDLPTLRLVNPENRIVVVKLFPGIDVAHLKTLTRQGSVHGIILETYEDGKSPTNESFLKAIASLAEKGTIIINISQTNCNISNVDIRLLEAGVINGGDMTISAAFTKLQFLLGNIDDQKLMGSMLEQSFRGEMTITQHNNTSPILLE